MKNPVENDRPTSFPEVNAILQVLLGGVQGVLGPQLIGMYLEGSLAGGDFDQDSDIDFVVVTDGDIPEKFFQKLWSMHEQLNLLDTYWSTNLEGSYMSRAALRRHDPNHAVHPNIERGYAERLKWADHDETWNIHRHILRERGLTIIGPDPVSLIDPITPVQLRQAMFPALQVWATGLLDHPEAIVRQGYQSYVVLSMCRILYTLQFGQVASKLKAAGWVKASTGGQWDRLIDNSWLGRHAPQLPAGTEDIEQTLELIRYVLVQSRQPALP
ncbi:MAG TPA: aminoglycoside adenylyltransferase domain-containing protein [Anaerolineales bacterium]